MIGFVHLQKSFRLKRIDEIQFCMLGYFLKAEQTECVIEIHQIFMVAHGQKNPVSLMSFETLTMPASYGLAKVWMQGCIFF